MGFIDRIEAGRQLAERLSAFASDDVVVLGLPRGGVPVAAEVAKRLRAPLDVILVRKLGVPTHPELAMGAIGESGVCIVNDEVIEMARVTPSELLAVEAEERIKLDRRAELLRNHRSPVELKGKIALIIDDGLATGSTAIAACEVARASGAKHVVMAVPVAPVDAAARLKRHADEFVCVETPSRFNAVGAHYLNFAAVPDDQVVQILDDFRSDVGKLQVPNIEPVGNGPWHQEVLIPIAGTPLPGRLEIPENPIGLVLFAHGSGSSRHSPRNTYVADVLNRAHIGTLLFDLLSREEERNRTNVFDITLLARRLYDATKWVRSHPQFASLPIGYFGASTGAAAALVAATFPSAAITAIVSRGGRPDLGNGRLGLVRAPTLLIVGGEDHVVLALNKKAESQLRCESKLVVISGATHLFEEAGTLEQAAEEARKWFEDHMIDSAISDQKIGSSLQ